LSFTFNEESKKVSMELELSGRRNFLDVANQADSSDPYEAWWMSYLATGKALGKLDRGGLRIADLFCGPGGLSSGFALGCKLLGYQPVHQLAVDVDEEALRVAARNHHVKYPIAGSTAGLVDYKVQYLADGNVTFAEPPIITDDTLGRLVKSVDVVIAGPPCQGHSTANKNRKFFDQRNLLYLTVPAIAIALEAPFVVIENVPGVQASQQGVVQSTWQILEAHGYSVSGAVLDASRFGWVQQRKRYFMVASKKAEPLDFRELVIPMMSRQPAMPLSTVIGDLVDTDEISFMTEEPKMTVENMERIRYLHENDLYDLPDSERNQAARLGGTTYRSVYGRMYWDRPCQTLTTGFMSPGRGRYVHPLLRRTINPREAARLQGFPDSYIFDVAGPPARTALAKWIGDAVPAPLGLAAAISVLGAL
jgi:DNA (cytosine-5)-methyltransferase 1